MLQLDRKPIRKRRQAGVGRWKLAVCAGITRGRGCGQTWAASAAQAQRKAGLCEMNK